MRQRAALTFGEQQLSPFASFARDFSRELNREMEKDFV
jgi:hypothetical protein